MEKTAEGFIAPCEPCATGSDCSDLRSAQLWGGEARCPCIVGQWDWSEHGGCWSPKEL